MRVEEWLVLKLILGQDTFHSHHTKYSGQATKVEKKKRKKKKLNKPGRRVA